MVDNLNEAHSAELAIIISYLNITVSGFKYAHKISLRILPDFICKKNPIFNFFLINILSRRVQLPYLENMVQWLIYHDG